MVSVVVRFGNDIENESLRWNIRNNQMAVKWLEVLKASLPYGINERDRLYNMPNQSWSKERICEEMIACMEEIETTYHGIFDAWPVPTMDHSVTNVMHVAFEKLRGERDHPTDLYVNAPGHIKDAINRYNILIHRWESFVQNGPPRIVCTFKKPNWTPLLDEDFGYFSMHHTYGGLLINYPQVGKQLLDVFRDSDTDVSAEAIRPMNSYASGFTARFTSITEDQAAKGRVLFDKWFDDNSSYLSSLGFIKNDPRLALGWIQVGDLDGSSFNSAKLETIGRLGRIYDVWIEE